MMKKFKKEDSIPEAESVMELKPEEAPEPVPERKTSDEMIIEMAQSARNDLSRTSEKPDEPEAAAQDAPYFTTLPFTFSVQKSAKSSSTGINAAPFSGI